MGPFPELDWGFAATLALSLGLGGLIGLERQQQEGSERGVMGVRTFALISLLGTMSALGEGLSGALPYIVGGGVGALLVVRFAMASRRDHDLGVTSEVAALLVFVLGTLVPGHRMLASAVAVVVFAVLAMKEVSGRVVERIRRREIVATVKFLLLTVVLLPLLPEEPVDPWGIYAPRSLWLLVVLISGIGFAGYFAMRFWGRRRGIAITGALGGLASSTAVTMAMSQRVAEAEGDEGVERAAVFSILAANTIMIARTTLAVLAVEYVLLGTLWAPVAAMLSVGVVVSLGALAWMRRAPEAGEEAASAEVSGGAEEADGESEGGEEDEDDAVGAKMNNPFQLGPALKFGVLFVAIIGAVHVANARFGDAGLLVAACISGLADSDAISITLARMMAAGDIGALKATQGVTLALLANSLSKTLICATMGSLRLGGRVLLGQAWVLGAGGVALAVLSWGGG